MTSAVEAASSAYEIAKSYAIEQMTWYADSADEQLVYFRTAGIVAIISSIAVAALAATLRENAGERAERWFALRKRAVVLLALAAAMSSALSGFFSWQQNWESYRKTHLQIEYLLNLSELQLTEIQANGDETRIHAHALALMQAVRAVVARETDDYYARVKSIEQALEQGEESSK